MAKRLQEYVKYTIKELNEYAQTEGSCVRKVNTNFHLSMGPFSLADFKHVLMAHIVRSKVGSYDVQLDGIVLDVKKVKVLGELGAMRADDPRIHVNINADAYVFKPEEGAVLTGVVKHIGAHHVGVVLYRVFNANLRVGHKVDKDEIQIEQEVKFRINNYNLQNVFPYIDGELLTAQGETIPHKGKKIFNKDNDDSGIEEKVEGIQELDELLSIIKTEEPQLQECDAITSTKKKSKKASKKTKDDISSHLNETPTPSKKSTKKRKSSTSLPASVTTDSCEETAHLLTPKKIKREKVKSEDDVTPQKSKQRTASETQISFDHIVVKHESVYSDD
ncbi:DNA-directed RNA polymerase I subunit RPA43 [Stomoxys calcitrans]|uniref:DNA-directed RNA polymerase I subunit RPA43 n=1 Tax=Stomoxys calcitrans TaxID=35570 RepID=UPI0027E28521|nr:DNA-directed RNA polymerase I subunit RPA43 [Stomoxys calcitrans]XP_059220668.1 DNA-directed RNA polymerase I subunit RPA43 [Stomoxys calcitrans]